jgi:8-oxo-dGTP pyrophosphatase MutT (NUDIX family)
VGRAVRLAAALPGYARIAWWGLATPRRERTPLIVHQGVIVGDAGVLLAMRAELRGWELPGGAALPGESGEAALRREVAEETGLAVEIEALVGDYHRSGFRPHTARVYRCRVSGGALRASAESPAVAWFDPIALPRTLFPWFRGPLADGLAELPEPVVVRERQGWRHVLAGMVIDLCTRWRGSSVGRPRSDLVDSGAGQG